MNGADLTVLLGAWGGTGPADLDQDGTVDGADVALLFGDWGDCSDSGLVCGGGETIALDSSGHWTVPAWDQSVGEVGPVVVSDPTVFGASYSVIQSPASGTEFTGPGVVQSEITITGENGHTEQCKFLVKLVDHTAPIVTIQGVVNEDRFVVGRPVAPIITATDAVSSGRALTMDVLLNGQRYVSGTPITAPGVYTLQARATDAAGNVGEATAVTFDIWEFRQAQGVAVVDSFSCAEIGEFAEIDATLLVGAELSEATAADLDLYSMVLWPLNSQGFPLTTHPIYIDGTTDVDGFYVYPSASQAGYENGYWRLHFRATVAEEKLLGCPLTFRVSGSGKIGERDEFDFEALTPAIPNPNPVGFMLAANAVNNVPAPPAAPNPCPKCKWKQKWDEKPADNHNASNSKSCTAGPQTWRLDMKALSGWIWGDGFANDHCLFNAQTSHSVIGSGDWTVWLEGRYKCCEPATISVTMQPSFKAAVEIDPPAKCYALGGIQITTDCGNKTALAKGGAEVSDQPATELTFGVSASVNKDGPAGGGSVMVKTTLTQGANSADLPFADAAIGTCNTDQVKVAMVGIAAIKVLADADAFNWYAEAKAWIYKAARGIKIEAKCSQDSQCAGTTFEDKWD